MARLNTEPNIADADGVYQKLIDAHQGLTEADSMALNARLILILINHVGDKAVVSEAIDIARKQGA
ncbi:MAG: DUF2783 domain-containing protein [Parvularculaceae bacterium]